jgi:hypothetical protein
MPMTSDSTRNPITAGEILLTLAPGLLAALGLVNGDTSAWSLIGTVLLVLFIAAGWLRNNRRLPGWSLMGVGLLLGIAQPVVLGVLGVLAALITNTPASPVSSPFILAIPWIGAAVASLYMKPDSRRAKGIWFLAAAILLCNILVRVKYFILYGVSWTVLGEMLGVSLWSAGTLLLPILVCGLLARRYGAWVILFATGATFAWFQILIDNAYKVSANIGSPALLWVYLLIVRSLFIVVGPWLFLRAKGMRRKLLGLIGSVVASVVINIVVSGMVRGDFTWIIWLSSIPYTLSVGLSLILAYWLFRSVMDTQTNYTKMIPDKKDQGGSS